MKKGAQVAIAAGDASWYVTASTYCMPQQARRQNDRCPMRRLPCILFALTIVLAGCRAAEHAAALKLAGKLGLSQLN
jgi:hypothetical protein